MPIAVQTHLFAVHRQRSVFVRASGPNVQAVNPLSVHASPVVGGVLVCAAQVVAQVRVSITSAAPAAPPPGPRPPPRAGAQAQVVSSPGSVAAYVQAVGRPPAVAVHASPVFGIVVAAGQPAGFVAPAPPVPVAPPVVVPVPPVVVPAPPAVVPVPPVVVPVVPPLTPKPPPVDVPVVPPPVTVSEPPVSDEPALDELEPAAAESSLLEPPQDAVSAKPPTSIRPKPYFRAFMDSSSGARSRIGPKLHSQLRE
jgi:hypothetical protein